MRRFALPAIDSRAVKAVVGVVAITVALLLLIDRAELLSRIDALSEANRALTEQNRGPQGPDGDPGRAPTADEILAAVAEYCSTSNLCVGPAGADGKPGATGSTGATGASVGSVKCNGTSISFYSTTGALLGNIKMVCLG